MYSVIRKYEFSAAHRLKDHKKCSRLHGHNYGVTVAVCDTVLNAQGMVMDFSTLDAVVDPILKKMDHRYIHPVEQSEVFGASGSETFFMPTEHSTAECIAKYICDEIRHTLISKLLIRVEVAENQRSIATYVSSK